MKKQLFTLVMSVISSSFMYSSHQSALSQIKVNFQSIHELWKEQETLKAAEWILNQVLEEISTQKEANFKQAINELKCFLESEKRAYLKPVVSKWLSETLPQAEKKYAANLEAQTKASSSYDSANQELLTEDDLFADEDTPQADINS